MDENTMENIHYEFELKKIIGDDLPYNNAEIQSDLWSDDLDSNFEDKPQEHNDDNNVSYSILYGKDTDEAKLIEDNIDLYSDLIKIEEEQKKAKQIHETEFENCKKEIEKLKETDARNKSRIEELKRENANLKQSISSLYRTVKREIEFKDKRLAEANSEIARLESLTGCVTTFPEYRTYPNYMNNSSTFRKDNNTYKRKRSESPESSSSKKSDYRSGKSRSYETDSETSKSKKEKKSEPESTKNKHDLEESEKDKRKTEKNSEHVKHDLDLATKKDEENVSQKQASKITNRDKETQTSNECIFCKTHKSSSTAKNSRDPREINDMFFNLLPDFLKQSFYDYEQDQMISLNKLKEAFIDEYLNSKSDAPSPILESTPKTKDNKTDKEELSSSKNYKNRPSSIVSTPTSSSEHNKSIEYSRRGRRNESHEYQSRKDYAQSHTSKVPENCYNSRWDRKNSVVHLFKLRKEEIPFSEKKKLGFHKRC